MSPRARPWLTCLAGLTCLPSVASAHPHIWIEAQETLRFDGHGRIDAVLAHWQFDDLYSAFTLEGLDRDGDGTYSTAELEPMRAQMHESLRSFGYFTMVTADDRPLSFADATEVSLAVEDGILILNAVLPLTTPIDPRGGRFALQVLDPSYYVAFDLAATDPVHLAGDVPAGCASSVQEPRDPDTPAPTLSDDLAINADLARSYAMADAPQIRVACS